MSRPAMASSGGEDACEKMFQAAVSLVLKDDGFSVPSRPATRARELARTLLDWRLKPENKSLCLAFSTELVQSLEECCGTYRSVRMRRERMWENYFKLRSSEEFKDKWTQFLSHFDASKSPCPVFYQFVTDTIMEETVKRVFPVESIQREQEPTLDYEEHNAVRYTAGYVARALTRKLQQSAHPMKRELILCLAELTEDDTDSEQHPSEDWLKAIDRGGLKHVSDITYMFFSAMELALRKDLNSKKRSELPDLTHVTHVIANDDDVLFYWSMVSVSWEEEEAQVLLLMIVEHWITIRGFSLAGAFMEKYKQCNKKHIQKSKGIRKRLQTKVHVAV